MSTKELVRTAILGHMVALKKIKDRYPKSYDAASKEVLETLREEHKRGSLKPSTTKRNMSAAGRKRIVAAQKKRWAEYHCKQEAAAATAALAE